MHERRARARRYTQDTHLDNVQHGRKLAEQKHLVLRTKQSVQQSFEQHHLPTRIDQLFRRLWQQLCRITEQQWMRTCLAELHHCVLKTHVVDALDCCPVTITIGHCSSHKSLRTSFPHPVLSPDLCHNLLRLLRPLSLPPPFPFVQKIPPIHIISPLTLSQLSRRIHIHHLLLPRQWIFDPLFKRNPTNTTLDDLVVQIPLFHTQVCN
jgi:hypothetical protein